MQSRRFLWLGLSLMTLWRLVLLPAIGLSPEEALVAMQAQRPLAMDFSLAGPLTGWLARVGMTLAGTGEFGLRWIAPILAGVTSVCLWHLTNRSVNQAAAGWAVLILNVTPGFNLAAVTMTPAITLYATTAGLAMFLSLAHDDPGRFHWRRLAAGGCLAFAIFATPAGIFLALSAWLWWVLAFAFRPFRDLQGLVAVFGPPAFALSCWFIWEAEHGWMRVASEFWRPNFWLMTYWFRWAVMGSLGLPVFFIWQWATLARGTKIPPLHWILMMASLPLVVGDFFWGAKALWPDTGLSCWQVLVIPLAAKYCVKTPVLRIEDSISWRTILLLAAAMQSVFWINTDFVRTLGVSWRFEQRLDHNQVNWLQFASHDPSSAQRGWQEAGRLVADIVRDVEMRMPVTGRFFLIASHWRLAASLDHALPEEVSCFRPSPQYPRAHALSEVTEWNHPFAWLPRYDARAETGETGFADRNALFICDDSTRTSPPSGIVSSFARVELLTVAQVMHAGERVRELKIFACYSYRAPQL